MFLFSVWSNTIDVDGVKGAILQSFLVGDGEHDGDGDTDFSSP